MSTNDTNDTNHAYQQAAAHLANIASVVATRNASAQNNDDLAYNQTYEEIQDLPLSIEVRSGWHLPTYTTYMTNPSPEEYRILLCTGGPAVQITGDLNDYAEPITAKLQYQDWFTPWENYHLTANEEQILLDFAQLFYYGG